MSGDGKLTPKQARFVQEYLVDLNATQAAIRSGYSEGTAHAIGWENLRKPEIEAAINDAMAARAERVEVTAEMVVAGLHTEATRDGKDASHSARVAAWTTLARHLGMLKDNVKLEGVDAPVVKIYLPGNGRDPAKAPDA